MDLLTALCEASGTSGREDRVREVVRPVLEECPCFQRVRERQALATWTVNNSKLLPSRAANTNSREPYEAAGTK